MDITVRDLDESVFRKFKGKAAERGMKMGVAVSHAMRLFIEKEMVPAQKESRRRASWNRDTTSKEIESLLSGE